MVRPRTFINLSGEVVAQMMRYSNFQDLSRLVVLHDDLDMASCAVKTKRGGGSGGHRGINSLISSLGEGDFSRIKIGIGRPPSSPFFSISVADWVLAPFSSQELQMLRGEVTDQVLLRLRELMLSRKEQGAGGAPPTQKDAGE